MPGFDSWVRKIPWKRKWQPTPVFFPGEFHGQRSLVGYSPWVPKELDTTEWLTHSFIPSPEISVTTVPVLRLIIQIPFHCIINLLIRLQIFNLCFWIYDLPSLWRYTVAFLDTTNSCQANLQALTNLISSICSGDVGPSCFTPVLE